MLEASKDMKDKLFAFMNNYVQKQFSNEKRLKNLLHHGYANGYVAVPPSHPLHGMDYCDADAHIAVWGGLTFGESMQEMKEGLADVFAECVECINFECIDEIPNDYWVFGFDTLHFNDSDAHDRDWCIHETNALMKQLEKVN